jgi:hypothetical protein
MKKNDDYLHKHFNLLITNLLMNRLTNVSLLILKI